MQYRFVFLTAAMLLASCGGGGSSSGSTPPVVPTPTPSSNFTLEVTNGSVSGSYAGGSTVNVWAAAPAAGMTFSAWTGSTSYLADANAWHTTVTAPAGAIVNVRATYVAAPSLTNPTTLSIPGSDTGTSSNRSSTPTSPAVPLAITYVIPASHPAGVIVEFYGSQGYTASWFVEPERILFNEQALAHRFGIIAMTSAAPGYWDTADAYPNNLDHNNVATTLAYLRSRGTLAPADKVYAVGASDGGAYASEVSRALNMNAAAIVIDNGPAIFYAPGKSIDTAAGPSQSRTPTIWALATNDGTSGVAQGGQYSQSFIGIGPAGLAQAHCNAEQLATATTLGTCDTSVTTNPFPNSDSIIDYYMNSQTPAYPDRFALVPGISATKSEAIYSWMQSQGCLSAAGALTIDPYQSPDFGGPDNFKCSQGPLMRQFGLSSTLATYVVQEDLVMYGEHEFMADFSDRIISFFLAH